MKKKWRFERKVRGEPMKKKWRFEIDQNGGEYTGWVEIIAVNVEKTGATTLIADGVEMEFDERIYADTTPNK